MKKIFAIIFTLALSMCLFSACSCKPGYESDRLCSYEIEASFDGADTLTCSQKFNYVNRTDGIVETLYFHLYPAAYREGARFPAVSKANQSAAYYDGISYGGIEITSVSGDVKSYEIGGQDCDILEITPAFSVEPDGKCEIEIDFTVKIPSVRHRLGKIGETVNLGNWYPILCATGASGADTSPYYTNGDPFFSECADYTVSLSLPSGYVAATTGTERASDGGTRVVATANNVRDFAAVLGKFDVKSENCGGVEVNYYYLSDENPEKSLKAATDSVKTFSELFGAYPYESYDVVQTGFLHGGMEYPRLVMISDALPGSLFAEAIIHETAHQWWYSAVGSNQIEHAWLDEGLAEYSTTLFYEKNPSYGVTRAQRMSDAASSYMVYDDLSLSDSRAMDRRLPDFETEMDYTFLTYVKGAMLFDSVRTMIGDERFFAALKRYFESNRFKIATPAHLIGEMEKHSGRALLGYFNSWLSGSDIVCE